MNFTKGILFIISILVISCSGSGRYDQIKFDKEKWLRGDRESRGAMVDNIKNDSILIGKSKLEVLDILGEPSSDTNGNFDYLANYGDENDFFHIGGTWVMGVYFDTTYRKVYKVTYYD